MSNQAPKDQPPAPDQQRPENQVSGTDLPKLQAAIQSALANAFPNGVPINPLPPMPGVAQGILQIQQSLQSWQAPYPPPEAVERYERVLPGTFNRLLTMAEHAQTAQIENARAAQRLAQLDQKRGQWLGWTITLCAMGCAVGCAYIGATVIAGLFLGVPVMAVAKALVDSAKTRASQQNLISPVAPTTQIPTSAPAPKS